MCFVLPGSFPQLMMKCFGIILLLSSFFSLSTCSSNKYFEGFDYDVQRLISEYLVNPRAVFGALNRNSRENQMPLMYFVQQRFDIPELDSVYENDLELQNVLELSFFANDPESLFKALVEDVIKGKKRYDSLYAPLVKYLIRKFKTFTPEKQVELYFENELLSLEHHLANYYKSKDDHKSAFEIILDNPSEIMNWFYMERDTDGFYEMLKENSEFLTALIPIIDGSVILNNFDFFGSDFLISRCIFRCVIHNYPDDYYIPYLIQHPNMLTLALKTIDFVSAQVPENHLERIHSQFKSLLSDESIHIDENDRVFCNYINDIRYGIEPIDIGGLMNMSNHQIRNLGKVALIAKKQDVFYQIFIAKEHVFTLYVNNFYTYPELENIMVVSEVLRCASEDVKNAIHGDYKFLELALNFYAIRNFIYENGKFVFDLVAPEYSLNHGVLPHIRCTVKDMGYFAVLKYWKIMQIADEETLYSFLCDFEHCPRLDTVRLIETSHEVIKTVLKSPVLIEKVKAVGIKFVIKKDFLEFIELIENDAEGLNEIFRIENFKKIHLTTFRTKKQLRNFEQIYGKSICEMVLFMEYGSMTGIDYFAWKLVLDFLIKQNQRETIFAIRYNDDLFKHLKLEYHDEMKEILA